MSKDLKKNTLTVSHNPVCQGSTLTLNREIKLKNVNWILGVEPDLKKEYSARIRYRQPLEKCHLKCQGSTLTVRFKRVQKAPTPGQSVVIYDACPDSLSGRGDICLCGGIIE